jgi:hypothetical protein
MKGTTSGHRESRFTFAGGMESLDGPPAGIADYFVLAAASPEALDDTVILDRFPREEKADFPLPQGFARVRGAGSDR